MATTALSVTALPGKSHSFQAKAAAVGAHTGLFTELSVIALPGRIHSFVAKAEAEDDENYGPSGMSLYAYRKHMARFRKEDEEILAIIMASVTSASLN